MIGLLADNGGFGLTHLPVPDGTAHDGGTNGGCPAIDQRGGPRPIGAACDVGAVEYEPALIPTATPTASNTPTATHTPTPTLTTTSTNTPFHTPTDFLERTDTPTPTQPASDSTATPTHTPTATLVSGTPDAEGTKFFLPGLQR